MIISSILNLKDYFKDFAAEQDIAFVYGTAKKLVQYSKSSAKFNYPILHLNRPIITSMDNDMANFMKSFHCEITCLGKYNKSGTTEDNDESEMIAESETLEILMKLENKMIKDNNNDLLIFSANTAITEPVSDSFIDLHSGWKMLFNIDFFANAKLQQ